VPPADRKGSIRRRGSRVFMKGEERPQYATETEVSERGGKIHTVKIRRDAKCVKKSIHCNDGTVRHRKKEEKKPRKERSKKNEN